MQTPEAKGPPSAEVSTPSTGKVIPRDTLAARRADAVGSIKQAELERKFGEELRWQKKQAEHFQHEYEVTRQRRQEVEKQLEALRAEMECRLKEAAKEIEELKSRGGERGTRAELDTMRREMEGLRSEATILAAKLADSSAVSGRQLAEHKERLAAATADKVSLEMALAGARQTAAALEEELKTARREVTEQRTAGQAMQGALDTTTSELAAVQAHCEHLTKQAGDLTEQLEASQVEANAMRAELAKAQAACADGALQLTTATAQADSAVAQALALQAQLDAARGQLKAVQADAAAAREELQALQDARAQERATANCGGAEVQALKVALEASQRELADLRAEYARAVFEMAKARAEHSEMAGKLAKACGAKDALAARLSALQLAHTEVELAAKLALDDVSAASHVGASDQHELGVAPGRLTLGKMARMASMGHAQHGFNPESTGAGDVGADGGMLRAMTMARRQLERVRQLASDALTAADRRVSEIEFKRSASMAPRLPSTLSMS